MKYSIGEKVLNQSTHPGQIGTVTEIDAAKKCAYRVLFPGRPAIWHPENELEPAEYQSSMDVESGLGIGGAGSDDYSVATQTQSESFAPQYSKHKSSGQLWEPCSKRGCDNEPVCMDCGYCLDKHCHCGE